MKRYEKRTVKETDLFRYLLGSLLVSLCRFPLSSPFPNTPTPSCFAGGQPGPFPPAVDTDKLGFQGLAGVIITNEREGGRECRKEGVVFLLLPRMHNGEVDDQDEGGAD